MKKPYTMCLESLREERKALLAAGKKLAENKELIMYLDKLAGKYGKHLPAASWYASKSGASMAFYMDVNSFFDPKLVGALEEISALFPESDFKSWDCPDADLREYTIRKEGMRVEINACIAKGSTKCRKVPVSEEIVTKYKFVCEGEAA